MDRRRFIFTGISAAAAGTALVSDACSGSVGQNGFPIPPVPPGSRVHTLVVQYATTEIKGYRLRTRTYNGRTIGPIIETRPGETLTMRIVNRFRPIRRRGFREGSVPIPVVKNSMEAMDALFDGPT